MDELYEWVYDMRELGLSIKEDVLEGVNDSEFKYCSIEQATCTCAPWLLNFHRAHIPWNI